METPTIPTPEAPASAPVSTSPTTYEECLALIAKASSENDPANLKAILKQLGSFFTLRVGKRKNETSRDGGDSVRNALAASRSFKPFTPKPL